MRKLFTLMVAICGLLLAACETENGIKKGEIFITSETNIEVGLYAGEFVIDYAVKGYEDVDATITTTSEWLRVKENRLGKATIQYEENTSGGMRQAAVMLSYEGSTATVVVSQSSEAVTPILTLVGEDVINLERAGETVVINYTLENTNPVDYVYAKTTADWVYSIECKGGKVTLGVATNMSGKERETKVTVGYGTASFDVMVKQSGSGDINFNAPTLWGDYLGDALTPGAGNYWFFLTDRSFDTEGKSYPNATYYRIDAYGPLANGSGIVAIPDGTYTYDPNNTYAQWTFTAEWSGFWVTDANANRDAILKFEEGATLVVEGNKITLNAKVNGEQHNVVFEGENALLDSRGNVTVLTTLDGDYEADLSDHYMVYECYGDYYEFGAFNWMFVIMPNDGSGDCMQLDVITGHNDKESGFAGDYVASDVLKRWSFIPGWTDGYNMQCSWYFNESEGEQAPFRGGEVSVVDNGDGTMTVDIDVKDDRRNNITGTWTGVPEAYTTRSIVVFNK
ncbi:MAG: BACON domain-containing protein [Alistipes sp.]|nr:BACON domain-containing protein [Alistipes sp.]